MNICANHDYQSRTQTTHPQFCYLELTSKFHSHATLTDTNQPRIVTQHHLTVLSKQETGGASYPLKPKQHDLTTVMERSPKSHPEEQSAVAESKRKLANSKLRLIWERSIGGPYQKREARRGRPGSHHQRRWRKMSETTRRWALHFSAEPLGFSIFHAPNSGRLVSVFAYSRVRPAQPEEIDKWISKQNIPM